ncbi:MAG: hypothetical protein ACKO2K_09795, partial [Alphaproteobacteria bacterium]
TPAIVISTIERTSSSPSVPAIPGHAGAILAAQHASRDPRQHLAQVVDAMLRAGGAPRFHGWTIRRGVASRRDRGDLASPVSRPGAGRLSYGGR